MNKMKTRLLIFSLLLVYGTLQAQTNEDWPIISQTAASTTVTGSDENHPLINLNYSYDDNPVEPGGGSGAEAIVSKWYRLYNNGYLNIGYSSNEGESYTSYVKINNIASVFYNNLIANENALINEKLSVGKPFATTNTKFHVEGTSRFNGVSTFNGSTKLNGNNELEFGPDLTKEFNAGKIGYQLFSNSLDIVGAGTTAGERSIKLWDKVYTPEMIIGNGVENTGVHGDAILHVNGKIVSKRVVATTSNWADYVFLPDYKLKSLNEVQDFINENGHLPNIPNLEKVQNEGVDLADMNRLLLEKVEELTLYVIDLQDQINDIASKQIK